jgi:2-haloacid dehalogenase
MLQGDLAMLSTYVFDAYGTLFDVHAAIGRYRDAAGTDAENFSQIWRTKQLEYTWTLTLAGHYLDFWTLTQRALDYALARFPSIDRSLRTDLLDAYLKLDAFPDVGGTLAGLKSRGARLAILSNGSPDMLTSVVDAAGLRTVFDAVLSVDTVRVYKPRTDAYALVTKELGVEPQEVAFISSNRWDIMGATTFGFRTFWINRSHMPDEYEPFPPSQRLTGLAGLLS